ncbi:MAG: hypothetical protein M1819_003040 [Sarea resinae]|nr:MAG: hypothetical protein M1819_003040 [Sarea resinae]
MASPQLAAGASMNKRKAGEAFQPPVSAFAASRARAQLQPTPPEARKLSENRTPVVNDPSKGADKEPNTTSSGPRGGGPSKQPDEDPVSTFEPSPKNILSNTKKAVRLLLRYGESLAVIGEYDLEVKKGAVMFMGAPIQAGPKRYRVYAPSTHAIPRIKAISRSPSDQSGTEIELHHCKHGMRHLSRLSPLFGRIWNEDPQGINNMLSVYPRSFSLLRASSRDPLGRPFSGLDLPAEWGAAIHQTCNDTSGKLPAVLICGAKSTGKSTFARTLVNHLLYAEVCAHNSNTKAQISVQQPKQKTNGVAFLDLDPGQPEYSPPGQVSLLHLHTPNFSPPYAHPCLPHGNGPDHLVRAHSIASVAPDQNPYHYIACAMDLLEHYHRLRTYNPFCPLVINCSGWVYGLGADVLADLIRKILPTGVVFMGEDPQEAMMLVTEATKQIGISLVELASWKQKLDGMAGAGMSSRSPRDLRAMQSLAYFHIADDPHRDHHLRWTSKPLTSHPPYIVHYSSTFTPTVSASTCSGARKKPGISDIIILADPQPPSLIPTILDGAVVAVVVLEKPSISPSPSQSRSASPSSSLPSSLSGSPPAPSVARLLSAPAPDSNTSANYPHTTPNDTPLFAPSQPPDPKSSHTLGVALVRAIDAENQNLHLLTPIPAAVLLHHLKRGHDIVLVAGRMDIPGWAYLEGCHATRSKKSGPRPGAPQNDRSQTGNNDDDNPDANYGDGGGSPSDGWEDDDDDDRVDDVSGDGSGAAAGAGEGIPWVSVRLGSEKVDAGDRVWRVRRNLGSRKKAK